MKTPQQGIHTYPLHLTSPLVKTAFYEVHYHRKHALLAYLLRRRASFKVSQS